MEKNGAQFWGLRRSFFLCEQDEIFPHVFCSFSIIPQGWEVVFMLLSALEAGIHNFGVVGVVFVSLTQLGPIGHFSPMIYVASSLYHTQNVAGVLLSG